MLDRRTLLKNVFLSSTGLIVLPHLTFNEEQINEIANADALEAGFLHPPKTSRPQAFWLWMNGHITKKGISLDLQMMKEIELAGAFIYNTGTSIPRGPVDFGSSEWDEMLLHAMAEAKRLGLELYMHNSPGFSSTGASWITPEMSMQQLVWSEALVKSNGSIAIRLPQPYKKLDYYRDAFVVAYPSLPVERAFMRDKITRIELNGKPIDKGILTNNQPESEIELNGTGDLPAELLLEFDEPFEARAITIIRRKITSQIKFEGAYDNPPVLLLESSDDGFHFESVCTIRMPLLRFMDAPGAQSFPAREAKYFRVSTRQETSISLIELHSAPRLTGWPAKVNFTDGEIEGDHQQIGEELIIDPGKVINITDKLQPDGKLVWDAPAGSWNILRIGHTCTGSMTASAPDSSSGLEIDKFSKEAVDFYFHGFLDKLFAKLKPFIDDIFKGILIDSWEIGKQNWSIHFASEFRQRRNYEITSWLPALTGRIVQSVNYTEKFLWDVRKTHADLVADNYYGQFRIYCDQYKLQLAAQPNGDGVFDSLQAGRQLQIPMAEFWTRYTPGTLNICKQAISIAHGYGKKIVAAEAFTGMPLTSRWTAYPYALKSQGDYIYSLGINRFVLHAIVHQPYASGFPGMTFGPFGSHFDRNQTWMMQSKEWINYLTRTQYLLQQGFTVADICYFKGEEPASGIPDVNYVDPPTPRTLAGDVIGPDVLLGRMKIEDNKIVLPDGMRYSLLIMAPLKRISPRVLLKLKELVFAGMSLIVTSRPESATGLSGEPEASVQINKLTKELFDDLDGWKVKERTFGKGRIYWNKPFTEILDANNIKPDFEFTAKNNDAAIHYTHRRAGDTEIYFISNHLRRRENLVCSFRSSNKSPEIWNAETGEIYQSANCENREGRIFIPVELEPAGSLFILFRKKHAEQSFTRVIHNGNEIVSTKSYPLVKPNPYPDIINSFTIAVWVKPDTYAYPSKGVIIFPPEAEIVYGTGHAACGLAAGQNMVRVFEREKGPNRDARLMIESSDPLEGWTHLVLRYEHGKPSLFINSVPARKQDGSGKIIHPGIDTAPTDELFSASFEGNHTRPQLFEVPLSNETILELYGKGLPPPDLPSAITLRRMNKKLKATIWENGSFVIKTNRETKEIHITDCKTILVDSPWQVQFPPGSGAPSSIQMEKLTSLLYYPDFGVKHFSGTVVYTTYFYFPEKKKQHERKILLDLGRVETIAKIKLNGRDSGVLWKEPFYVDITKSILHGINKLEVFVTNLWPNRMIGDEYLPPENDYDENGLIKKFPDWYLKERPKPGQRITFSAWNTFKKTDPLLESGLLGPVRLVFGIEKIIES